MGRDTSGTLFPKEKGAFPKNKKGTSLFVAKFGEHVSPVAPGSYVYDPTPETYSSVTSRYMYFV